MAAPSRATSPPMAGRFKKRSAFPPPTALFPATSPRNTAGASPPPPPKRPRPRASPRAGRNRSWGGGGGVSVGNIAFVGGGGLFSGAARGNCTAANNAAGSRGANFLKAAGPIPATGANLIGSNDPVATEFPAGALVGTPASPKNPLLAALGNYG